MSALPLGRRKLAPEPRTMRPISVTATPRARAADWNAASRLGRTAQTISSSSPPESAIASHLLLACEAFFAAADSGTRGHRRPPPRPTPGTVFRDRRQGLSTRPSLRWRTCAPLAPASCAVPAADTAAPDGRVRAPTISIVAWPCCCGVAAIPMRHRRSSRRPEHDRRHGHGLYAPSCPKATHRML